MSLFDFLRRSPAPLTGGFHSDIEKTMHERRILVFFDPDNAPVNLQTRRFLQMVGHWDGSQLILNEPTAALSIPLKSARKTTVMPMLPAVRKLIEHYEPMIPYLEGMEFVVNLTMSRIPEEAQPIPTRPEATASKTR
jgi:hypothetical protein